MYTLYKYNYADHRKQHEMKIKKLKYPLGQASQEVFQHRPTSLCITIMYFISIMKDRHLSGKYNKQVGNQTAKDFFRFFFLSFSNESSQSHVCSGQEKSPAISLKGPLSNCCLLIRQLLTIIILIKTCQPKKVTPIALGTFVVPCLSLYFLRIL